MTGKFIVLEGTDGSGTTTHVKLLSDALRQKGYEVLTTHEPTSLPIGKLIRQYLSDGSLSHEALALLFAADRCQHVQEKIIPALNAGKVVISDRFLPSSIIYQSMSLQHVSNPIQWIGEINRFAIKPDAIFWLGAPLEILLQRVDSRESREIFETKDLIKTSCEWYENIYNRMSGEFGSKTYHRKIDTSADIDCVFSEILTTAINEVITK